tara:strand:+ start:7673 stop:8797 length:1125 start_codon:yes stop_codon:yes gene_type:complete
MISKIKNLSFFVLAYVLIDIFLSYFLFHLIFLNLEKFYQADLENRIFNKEYKYTFKRNTSFSSRYNDFIYKIDTNNFGFRSKNLGVLEDRDRLVFLAGDSFLEGVGLNFQDTLHSHLEKKFSEDFAFLNAGVASYSTYIYKKKIFSFIESYKDLKIERVIIFFDKSDPIDDKQYYSNPEIFQKPDNQNNYKNKLSEKSITFALLKILGNFLDEEIRSLKYRYLISKKFSTNFFSLNDSQIIAFKSIGNRRFISSYYTDPYRWENETKKHLLFSFEQLKEIEKFLKKRNIKLDIILYPWSYELMNKNSRTNYLDYIKKINEDRNLNIHHCYDFFLKSNSLEQLEFIGQTYLFADVHYNSKGYKILAECVKNKLSF